MAVDNTFHICVDGEIKPYPWLVCSRHRGTDPANGTDFDALAELTRLRAEVERLDRLLVATADYLCAAPEDKPKALAAMASASEVCAQEPPNAQ